jgi:hypothetical protein
MNHHPRDSRLGPTRVGGARRERRPGADLAAGGERGRHLHRRRRQDTFAAELVRTDQVAINEHGAAVHVGAVVIHFADDAYITPDQARVLAVALVELADYADGLR